LKKFAAFLHIAIPAGATLFDALLALVTGILPTLPEGDVLDIIHTRAAPPYVSLTPATRMQTI
jgi:hypothetical protein